ncbi:MAG: hypothetical protein NT027_13705 [Proteobacteria bacterium]|nr:hypothetical protein [Pseudomonadota bacterium]
MDFKKMRVSMIFLIGMGVHSCGANNGNGVVGSPLTSKTGLYSSNGVQSNFMFSYDQTSSRIMKLKLSDLSIAGAYSVASDIGDHYVVGHPEGKYVLDFGARHLEIIKEDGSKQSKPFNFQGVAKSAAYDSSQGLLVMQDDLNSIGIMQIADTGDIKSSWLGGSLIGESKSVLAGDIDKSGKFLILVSDGSILTVDVGSTLTQQKWAYTSSSDTISKALWIAGDTSLTSKNLIVTEKDIYVFDSGSSKVTETKNLIASDWAVVANSKSQKPHVLVKNTKSGTFYLVYIDSAGALSTKELPPVGISSTSDLFLSSDLSKLTLVGKSSQASGLVYQIRLSDNLVLVNDKLSTQGEILVSDKLAFINRRSKLGFLETINFETGERKELKAYNLEFFRDE